jgi:CubicO group peptidase (beta-lactamase class C family)
VRAVERVVEEHLARGVAGAAVAIVEDGRVMRSETFGVAHVDTGEAVTRDTRFRIQSVTKTVVAIAVLRLVERGSFGLDEPVADLLGAARVANAWERARPVTVRSLLTHTAGLPVTMGPGTGRTLAAHVAEDVATEVPPGTHVRYANWGYDVLGYLLECATGRPWDAVVRDEVLAPLGMFDTSTDPTHGRVAAGHTSSNVERRVIPCAPGPAPYPSPAGSLVSTGTDVARLLVALLGDGSPVLTEASIDTMRRVHAAVGPHGGMGLGLRVDRRGEHAFVCHGGDGEGFTTFAGGRPGGRGVVILLNTNGASVARSEIMRAALPPSVAAPGPQSTRPPTGRFRSTFWDVRAEVSEAGGEPAVAVPHGTVSFSDSTTRLVASGDRWLGIGGLFDGWELDFDTTTEGDPRFCGGAYPFGFVRDDTPIVRVPDVVEQNVDMTGAWTGTVVTPLGELPLTLQITADGPLALTVAGIVVDARAGHAVDGRVNASFGLDAPGLGTWTLHTRLGVVDGSLVGLTYARGDVGEFAIPTVLTR